MAIVVVAIACAPASAHAGTTVDDPRPAAATAGHRFGAHPAAPPATRSAVVRARVTRVRPVTRGGRIQTAVVLRLARRPRSMPREVRLTLDGGRRGSTFAVSSAWPLWRAGMRVRARFVRSGGRWTFASAREIGAGARAASHGPQERVDELPLRWAAAASLPAGWRDAIEDAAGWINEDPHTTARLKYVGEFAVPPDYSDCRDHLDTFAVLVDVAPLPEGEQGRATSYYSGQPGAGGTILCTDVLLAESMFCDLRSVAGHELLHALGMVHSGDATALMWPRCGGRPPFGQLAADDLAHLRGLYPGHVSIDVIERDGLVAGGSGWLAPAPEHGSTPVRISFVTGRPCDPVAIRMRVEPNDSQVLGGSAYDPSAGTIAVVADPQDPGVCHADLTVARKAGAATAVRLVPTSRYGDLPGEIVAFTVPAAPSPPPPPAPPPTPPPAVAPGPPAPPAGPSPGAAWQDALAAALAREWWRAILSQAGRSLPGGARGFARPAVRVTRRHLVVRVRNTHFEAIRIRVSATERVVTRRRGKRRASRRFRYPARTRRIAAGRTATIALRAPAGLKRRISRAQRGRSGLTRRPVVTVTNVRTRGRTTVRPPARRPGRKGARAP